MFLINQGDCGETKKLSLDLIKLLPDKEEELEVSLSTSNLMSKDKAIKGCYRNYLSFNKPAIYSFCK